MHCVATEGSTDAQQYCDILNIFFAVAAASDKKKKNNLDIKKKARCDGQRMQEIKISCAQQLIYKND